MKCNYCGGEIADGILFCPHCGVACAALPTAVPVPPPPAPRVRKKKERPPKVDPRSILREMKCMKWHKFTVNFLLFVEFLAMLAGGAAYFFGYAHASEAALIYKYYPQLKTLDLAAAGVSCLLAILVLVVRFRLARLRRGSRGLLYLFYIAAILFPVGYQVVGYLLCRASLVSLGYVVHVAVCLLLLVVYIVYYSRKKRRGAFVL